MILAAYAGILSVVVADVGSGDAHVSGPRGKLLACWGSVGIYCNLRIDQILAGTCPICHRKRILWQRVGGRDIDVRGWHREVVVDDKASAKAALPVQPSNC